MNRFLNLLFHRPSYLVAALWKRIGVLVPDAPYLKVLFCLLMGKRLNLKNPKTFNEKLQWLKLYDRNPEYIKMVDKYAVKDYVSNKIGKEYIIPTLGVWDRVEDIEWDKLPNQFVLKCTHDSGGLVICKDKSQLDKKAAIKKLNKGLKSDYFKIWREWPYKNVPRRIIAEQYIEPDAVLKDLPDYKIFCFGGEPKIIQLDFDRFKEHKKNLYSVDWQLYPFGFNYPPHPECHFDKPEKLDEMLRLARALSQGLSYSRIDFYWVNGRIYFGEITFFPASGMGKFDPEEWDYTLGEWLKLPVK